MDATDLDLEAWSRSRLGATLTAVSAELTSNTQILPQQFTLAYALSEAAVELDPDSAPAWERLLAVASVLKDEDPDVEATVRRAMEALVRLRPDDAVMRLRLLLDRIDARPTAEGRIEAYETLLSPENIERLGPLAAARLAFDLAVLQVRVGDLGSAATRVIEAVNLDPSYPQAAEMLAGLLRSASTTSVEEAELLSIAFTASPLDGVIARRLGQLILADGAYATAADILNLALILTPQEAGYREDLVADEALALWGDGRVEEALELLESAKRQRTRRIRTRWIAMGLEPSAADARPVSPSPSLALIKAVIVGRTGSETDRQAAVDQLFESFLFQRSEIVRDRELVSADTERPEAVRNAKLTELRRELLNLTADQAWARAWFGWTPPTVDGEASARPLSDLLDEVVAGGALTAEQRLVIEGWWAIHQEDFDRARALLAPMSASSAYAAAGLALLEELTGSRQDGARLYLDTYRDVPGRLVGLWCRSRLSDLLGTSVPPPARATAMAKIVDDTLPDAVGRALRDPRHGVLSVQVEPASLRSVAYEPLELTIKITNVSGLDLAIGPDGPLQPSLALIADAVDFPADDRQIAPQLAARYLPPLVVPIDRRFRLDAQETLTLTLDLTTTPFNRMLSVQSAISGTLRLRAVVNYAAAPNGAIDVGPFGREGRSPVFRIDGLLPPTEARVNTMMEAFRDPRTVDAARDIATMMTIATIARGVLPLAIDDDPNVSPQEREEARALELGRILSTSEEGCLALPPLARAWVMSVIPPSDVLPPRLVDRLVEDEIGLLVALARFSPSPTSAPVIKALNSTNPETRRLGEAARDLAVRLEALRQRAFDLAPAE